MTNAYQAAIDALEMRAKELENGIGGINALTERANELNAELQDLDFKLMDKREQLAGVRAAIEALRVGGQPNFPLAS